ncbi:MAG TPA: rod shape-determining protein RodA [Flavobacteriaceae bacterium]|nr:rod shape-determining protein RodA [Flavobacteriaceae bacterium]
MNRTQEFPDWITILVFIVLVVFGWMNIFSASLGETGSFHGFDFNEIYTKQAVWIGLSLVLIILIMMIEAKFYQRFSSLIYLISLLSLVGLFIFGKTISGQTAWYSFGSFSIQPAEFVKASTALALANYLSDIQVDLTVFKYKIYAFVIILIPAVLILGQPDPGSALIYAAFIFPLYREGLSGVYLFLGFAVIVVFVSTLLYGSLWVTAGVILILGSVLFLKKERKHFAKYILLAVAAILLSFSVTYIFENVFQQHHRDRFDVLLGKNLDLKGIGYNTHQSIVAIGSGGWTGKGWTEGTQTKGSFVPEQHTDYIFSTVGEEWGFVGSAGVVVLFVLLIARIIFLAERQRSVFSRVYGYSVAGILFIHFMVNLGMVIGIMPTVGIPLPFLSYGGSSLWGFTILIFVFLKLDAERKELTSL